MIASAFPNTPAAMTIGELARRLIDARAPILDVQRTLGTQSAAACLRSTKALLDPARKHHWRATDMWLGAHPSPGASGGASVAASPAPAPAPAQVHPEPEPDAEPLPSDELAALLLAHAAGVDDAEIQAALGIDRSMLEAMALGVFVKEPPDLRLNAVAAIDAWSNGKRISKKQLQGQALAAVSAPAPTQAAATRRADIAGLYAKGWGLALIPITARGCTWPTEPGKPVDFAKMAGKVPGFYVQGTDWGHGPTPGGWKSVNLHIVQARATIESTVAAGGNAGLALGAAEARKAAIRQSIDDPILGAGKGRGAALAAEGLLDAPDMNLRVADLDLSDAFTNALAPIISKFISDHDKTGRAPVQRHGRPGRLALLYATSEPLSKSTDRFKLPDDSLEKIEWLGQGQQVVVDGVHPEGHAYYCTPPLDSVRPEDLPVITLAQENEMREAVRAEMQRLGCTLDAGSKSHSVSGTLAVPTRAELVGDIAEVKELLDVIGDLPDRDRWIEFAHALCGATLDAPGDGHALFLEHSHHDSAAEVEEADRVWRTIDRRNLRSGIKQLRRLAGRPAERGQDAFKVLPPTAGAAASAPAMPQGGNPFQAQQDAAARRANGAEFLAKLNTGAITATAKASFHQNAPAPDVLVYPLLVRGHLSVLAGDGGTMKSMLALGMAYQIASGVPFISGDAVRVHHLGRVLFMTAEENDADIAWRRDKWRERARAMTNGGTDYLAQLFDGLDNAIIVSTSTETVDLFKSSGATEAMTELEALCRRTPGLDALIIDPAGSYSSADMKTEEFGGFVMALRAIAARQHIAILLLHHVSKAAVNQASGTGEDLTQHATLGSVMTINSARVGAVMQRMNKHAAQQWSVPEDEAHNFVGILAPKANGIPVMMEPAWYRNDGGVPIPVTLAHLDKTTVKQMSAEQAQQARTARMRAALLGWIEGEYRANEPPSKTVLAGVLASRIGIGDKALLAFLNSELSRGTLVLDDSIKASNRAQGAIRPGDVERLKREVRQGPVLPGDTESLFGTS